MALTKNDIVTKVHALGFTKNKSVKIIEALLEIIKRRGRNPATGDDLILEERKVVTFKCSGKLRDKINGKG